MVRLKLLLLKGRIRSYKKSCIKTLFVYICLLLTISTVGGELPPHLSPFLPSRGRSIDNNLYYSLNKINHKACKAGNRSGVCMFVWECMKTGGTHGGMCMDGFMFGSCCTHDDSKNDVEPPMDSVASASSHSMPPPSPSIALPESTVAPMINKYSSNPFNSLVTTNSRYTTRKPYRPSLLRPVLTSTTTSPRPSTPETTQLQVESVNNDIQTTSKEEANKEPDTYSPITIKPPKAPTRPTRPPKPTKPERPHITPWWIQATKSKFPVITKKPVGTTPKATYSSTTSATTTTTTTTTTAAPTTTTTTTPQTTTTRRTTTKPPATGPFTTNVHSDHVCGMQRMGPQPQGRIVNGTNSRYGEFPWQTSVRRTSFFGFSSTHRCGGALLNSKWVATAGHCVDDLLTSQIRLRVGEYDFSSVLEPYAYVERKAKKKVVHPNYNFFTYEYDLALVEMESVIEFQPHIQPICLPGNQDLLIGEMAKVTGWGRLSEHGTLPSILQQASVPIMSNEKCQEMFLHGGRKEHIPDIFLCAGYETGGRDSCQGDSGGPLQVKGADGRWFLAGIISWGIGCAEPNLPGVCTRISKFVPFILQHVT